MFSKIRDIFDKNSTKLFDFFLNCMFFMMYENMQIDFNYSICCLKARKLKPKFTRYHNTLGCDYALRRIRSAPQIENIHRLVRLGHVGPLATDILI